MRGDRRSGLALRRPAAQISPIHPWRMPEAEGTQAPISQVWKPRPKESNQKSQMVIPLQSYSRPGAKFTM